MSRAELLKNKVQMGDSYLSELVLLCVFEFQIPSSTNVNEKNIMSRVSRYGNKFSILVSLLLPDKTTHFARFKGLPYN